MKIDFLAFAIAMAMAGLADAKMDGGQGACTARTIKVTPSGSSTFAGFSLAVGDEGQSRLSVDRAYLIGAPCAKAITRAAGGQLQVSDNRVIELVAGGAAVDRAYDRSVFPLSEEINVGPLLEGRPMKMAVKVHEDRSSGSALKFYIGLWQLPGRSVLATFRRRGEVIEPARILLTSRKLLSSIGYFPSVDSNSGVLSLLQKERGQTRVIDLNFITDGWRGAA